MFFTILTQNYRFKLILHKIISFTSVLSQNYVFFVDLYHKTTCVMVHFYVRGRWLKYVVSC
jgi:hypothetical protein